MQPSTCLATAIGAYWCTVKSQAVAETGQLSEVADLRLSQPPLGPRRARGSISKMFMETRRSLVDIASKTGRSGKLGCSKVV